MGGKVIDFKDIKINKKDFYNNKKQFKIKDIDINKILISKPESYGTKNAKQYIIGYNDDVIRPIRIFLTQMNGYVKCFDDNKTMSFLADDREFLKEYNKVWEKIKGLIGKRFDAEPVYDDKYIKTKIKSYNNDIRTNFHGEGNTRKVLSENCSCKCFSLISLDSVIQMGKKYFPQTILNNDGESDDESGNE